MRSRAPQASFPSPRGRGWLAAGVPTCRGEAGEGSLPPLLRRSPHCLHPLEGKKRWGVKHPSAKQEPAAQPRRRGHAMACPYDGADSARPIGRPEGRPSVPPSHFPTGRKFERKIDINIPWGGEIVPIPLALGPDFSRKKLNTAVWPLPSAPTGRTKKARPAAWV